MYDREEECGAGLVDAYAALVYTLENHGGTLAKDVTVPAGETWDLGNVTLAFAPGKRLIVEGVLNADSTTFTASDPAQGWGGLRFEEGSSGALSGGALVERVKGYGGSSIYVHKASLTLDSTFVELPLGSAMTGLYVTGAPASGYVSVENGTRILNHPGDGIRATSGATVYVDASEFRGNGDGLSATNATIFTYDSVIEGQTAYGTEATSFGNVAFGLPFSEYPIPAENNDLRNNDVGDLRATSYAAISAGDATSFRNNNIIRPTAGGNPTGLHAYARTDSDVTATHDYWGMSSGPDLSLVDTDATSTFAYCPFLNGPGGTVTSCGGGGSEGVTARSSQSTTASKGPGDLAPDGLTVQTDEDRLADAREALNAGDAATAIADALIVAQTAESDGTRRAATVLLALAAHRDRSAPTIPALESLAVPGHPARHVALRALASIHVARGEVQAARLAADRLTRLVTGDDAAAGHALLALAELENGQPEAARTALANAEAALSGARVGDAALVDAVRTEIALREGTTLTPSGLVASAPPVSAAKGTGTVSAERLSLDAPRPNPSRGVVEVGLTLPEAGEVEAVVYDALGRRVAILVDGTREAGRHALSTEGMALPAGVYVVRATVQTAAGAETLTRTFTVVR